MRKLVFFLVCFVALLVPVAVLAGGGDGGFNGIVSSIEAQYHVKATRIPMMGLISFISSRATHGGVKNMHVAEFENFSLPMEGDELNRMVEQKLGEGWQRMVRETSRHGQSQTLVFSRPEGNRMGLFVLDSDGHDLNVVQLSVDPDHLNEQLGHYQHRSQQNNTD